MKYSNDFLLQTGEKIFIRNAIINDAQNILDFLTEVFAETDFLDITADEFYRTLKQQENLIKFYIISQNSIMLLAIKDKEIAGILTLTGKIGIKLYHRATLGLAVKKNYWGIGVAHSLMLSAMEVIKKSPIIKIELEVVTTNTRAIQLYKKFGFLIDGIIKCAKIYDGKIYDHYLMSKFVKEL